MDIQYKIGDTITAKFKPAFQEEVIVTGVIREFKGDMICCNQVGTSKPFFCLAEEVIRTNLSNAAMNIQKQAFEEVYKQTEIYKREAAIRKTNILLFSEKFGYFNIVTHDAWLMWQAAQKVAVPEPTKEVICAIENTVEDQLIASGITSDPFRLDGEKIYKAMIEAQEHSNG